MVAPAAARAATAATAGRGAAASRGAAGARTAGARGGTRKPRVGTAGGDASGAVERPTQADNQSLRSELRAQDAVYQAAYEAGQRGEPLGDEATDEQRAAWQAGDDERRGGRRDAARQRLAEVPAIKGPGWVNDGAGFVLGLIVYALGLNYLQGGAPQARGWIAAKFINKPYSSPAKAGGRVAK